jgi:hypothetical protein
MSDVNDIWYTRCPVPTTSGIAQHFKWLHEEFARTGVAVESIRASEDKAVRLSHFDHTIRARSARAATSRRCGRGPTGATRWSSGSPGSMRNS